jgi:hypothetical protein
MDDISEFFKVVYLFAINRCMSLMVVNISYVMIIREHGMKIYSSIESLRFEHIRKHEPACIYDMSGLEKVEIKDILMLDDHFIERYVSLSCIWSEKKNRLSYILLSPRER